LQRFGGDGSELTTSTEWTTERRSTALEILDEAFTRLDMEEVWDSLNVNKKELLESDTAWAEFRDDLASALDAYYGVSTV
jgi:hypothetical protein